jgi:hypothetical protein
MAKDRIEIEVLAKGVSEAQKDIEKLKKEIDKTGQQTKKSGTSMVTQFAAVAAGAFAAFQTIKKGMDLAKEFAKFDQSVMAMEKQFGVSADNVIAKLGEMAKGTISNADLIESANRAMALNVTTDIDEMAKLMEVARIRGQAMGLDTEQAFSDLVTGIGRGSPLILDNLGIITTGWNKEAKEAGKAMDTHFILNKVLADGATILERTGDVALTSAEKFQQMSAEADNMKLVIGKELMPVFDEFFESLGGDKAQRMENVAKAARGFASTILLIKSAVLSVWKVWTSVIDGMMFGFDLVQTFVMRINGIISKDTSNQLITKRWQAMKDAISKNNDDIVVSWKSSMEKINEQWKKQDEAAEEAELKRKEKAAVSAEAQVEEKTELALTLEQIEAEHKKRLEGIRKQALIEGIINEEEFTNLSLEQIKRRFEEEKRMREATTRIYSESLVAITDALFDFHKSAKTKLKEVFTAIIATIANEVIARGMAIIATGIATLNPAMTGRGTALVASASAIKGIGTAITSRFKDGTNFSPGGQALVGEAGPEIVELPQGSRVIPNNQITNNSNDNRNITINVQSNNAIELVNDLQSTYGINVFEGG